MSGMNWTLISRLGGCVVALASVWVFLILVFSLG